MQSVETKRISAQNCQACEVHLHPKQSTNLEWFFFCGDPISLRMRGRNKISSFAPTTWQKPLLSRTPRLVASPRYLQHLYGVGSLYGNTPTCPVVQLTISTQGTMLMGDNMIFLNSNNKGGRERGCMHSKNIMSLLRCNTSGRSITAYKREI